MKPLKIILFLLVAIGSFFQIMANDFTGNILLNAPHSPYLQSYQKPGKAILSITNNTGMAQMVTIHTTIKGASTFLKLKNGNAVQVSTLPNQTLQLTGNQIDKLFSFNNYDIVSGKSLSKFKEQGFDQGSYEMCITLSGVSSTTNPICGNLSVPSSETNISIQTQVIAPYPNQITSYFADANKIKVILTNNTPVTQNLKLGGGFAGDNVEVKISDNYIPPSPITIPANQMVILSGNEISHYFSKDNVIANGKTKDELYGFEGLPGGTYKLCLHAKNYTSNKILSDSKTKGCASFSALSSEENVLLTTQILPPYSAFINDYATNKAKINVLLTNKSSNALKLRLIGKIEGQGIQLVIPENFIPPTPINLQPNQTLSLDGSSLSAYLNLDQMQISGIAKSQLEQNGLPGGNYQVCLQALEFSSGTPMSQETSSSCSRIIAPMAQDAVTLLTQLSSPASPYIEDYGQANSKLKVTLTNKTNNAVNLRLKGSISGNGIEIIIPDHANVPMIKLQANETRILNYTDLQPYLGQQVVQVSGISKSDLYQGEGLPAGTYQVCFQALEHSSKQPRSKPVPSGCSSFAVNSQDQAVNVITQLTPPHSPYIDDYANGKLGVTLINTTDRKLELKLTGSISGNGITVQIPNSFQPGVPITLQPNQSLQLSRTQLQPYLQKSTLSFSGISVSDLYEGDGLPIGSYDFCIQAIDYQTNNPRSPLPPMGCNKLRITSDHVLVTTVVIPPHSPFITEYISKNKFLVTLTNKTGKLQKLRLSGQIEGSGIALRIPQGYIPNLPIVLQPFQTRQLTANELSAYINPDILIYEGIDQNQLTRTGLPEGNYNVCFQALSYESGKPKSIETQGCSPINIKYIVPPMLLQPICNGTVNALLPQNVTFNWTMPAGVNPSEIEYRLKVAEMLDQHQHPAQAIEAATNPAFFEKTVPQNVYIYNLSDPTLVEGRKYAVQITIRAKPGFSYSFENEGNSQVCSFTYGGENQVVQLNQLDQLQENINNNQPQQAQILNLDIDMIKYYQPQDPPFEGECISEYSINAPNNTQVKQNINVNTQVKVGNFNMKITEISANNNGVINGKGTIFIPFLNTSVKAEFTQIKVNTDNEVFGNNSKIYASMDVLDLYDVSISKATNGEVNLQNKMQAITNHINNNGKKVTQFAGINQAAVGLPFALDNYDTPFQISIVGLVFTPTDAYMNAAMGLEIMEAINNNWIDFGAAGIRIQPNGLAKAGKILLKNDRTAKISNNLDLKFKANDSFVTFDCQGVDEVSASGQLVFSRDVLLPVVNGNVQNGNAKVKADFNILIEDPNDWITEASISPAKFTTPALKDISHFSAQQIVYDHSAINNANSMSFHPNHPHKNNGWEGLFIKNIEAELTKGFKKGDNNIKIQAQNVLIDKTGFWAKISKDNVLKFEEDGNLEGWAFSIDNVTFDIQASQLGGGGMEGGIEIPISETPLTYSLVFDNENQDLAFGIPIMKDLSADFYFAKIDIDGTSKIILKKVNGSFRPLVELDGKLSLGWESNDQPNNVSVSNFSLPSLSFQDFIIENKGLNNTPMVNGTFALDNINENQGVLTRIPITLDPPGFQVQNNELKLKMGLGLAFDQLANGISGDTDFSLVAKYQNGKYKFDGVELNSVSIDADISVAQISGSIDIYSEDEVYGNGFRGSVEANIKALGGVAATLQIGKTLPNNGNYAYWMFDAMVHIETGIIIAPTALAFYGFGGGAYYNMERQEAAPTELANFENVDDFEGGLNNSPSGVTYTPKKGGFGFSASLALGLAGSKNVFNGDLTFGMDLSTQMGIEKVYMKGNAYVMESFEGDRSGEAFIHGYADILINVVQKSFDANFGMSINVANILKGGGNLGMHFSPSKWYVKLGEWQNADYPAQDNARINFSANIGPLQASFYGYFMAGTEIPGLPGLPAIVKELAGNVNMEPRSSLVETGKGVAFGTGFSAGFDRMNFLFFYAEITATAGFDMTIKDYGGQSCNGQSNFGINNWYGKGQAYAAINADVGVELDLWFWSGSYRIAQLAAYAVLQMRGPNPTYLAGFFGVQGEILVLC